MYLKEPSFLLRKTPKVGYLSLALRFESCPLFSTLLAVVAQFTYARFRPEPTAHEAPAERT